MTERHFAPGEVIYREGDSSDFGYLIKSGQVELLRIDAAGERRIAVLQPDEVFGEKGLILGQHRSVTARAIDSVVVRAIGRASFLHAVNQQPDAVRPLLRALLVRALSDQPDATAPAAVTAPAGLPVPPMPQTTARIRLLPASEAAHAMMQGQGIAVERLPFRVGRRPVKGEHFPTEDNDLAFEDAKPFNLSRRHFTIEQTRQGLIVRDCGSHLGTMVNGLRIGGHADTNFAVVGEGENEIVAGSETSPFRFTLEIASA